MEFACKMCFPMAQEIAQITDNIWLIKYRGNYHLLSHQGHSGDIIYTFTNKPYLEPDIDNDDEWNIWINHVMKFVGDFRLLPSDSYEMINGLITSGVYNPREQYFSNWFYEYCAELIYEYESQFMGNISTDN